MVLPKQADPSLHTSVFGNLHFVDAQGASLWTLGVPLARVIAGYCHMTEWHWEEEDPAMIWQIPKGCLQWL